jgi:hypothetical protein
MTVCGPCPAGDAVSTAPFRSEFGGMFLLDSDDDV